jgi:hypothetical protein
MIVIYTCIMRVTDTTGLILGKCGFQTLQQPSSCKQQLKFLLIIIFIITLILNLFLVAGFILASSSRILVILTFTGNLKVASYSILIKQSLKTAPASEKLKHVDSEITLVKDEDIPSATYNLVNGIAANSNINLDELRLRLITYHTSYL